MEDSHKSGKSWSIGTFIRILPNVKNAKTLVQYAHEDVKTANGNSRGILQIKIPDDADPGLSHNNSSGILEYEFDKVFNSEASQSDIFESIARDKIVDVFSGINSTIFAYGQTGSGKTYTIFGGDSFADRGLIPRSIAFLFKEIRGKEVCNFTVKCQVSFTEVYKETVYDLLDKHKKNLSMEQWTPVQVLEGENGLTLRNLNVFEVDSEDDALSLFFLGNTNRLTSATVMNDASSRSHAIFTMIIESKGVKDGKTIFTCGKMNFVDLAGSERIYKIASLGAKETIEEAKSINLSLHYLEQVIVSLRDQSHSMMNSSQGKNLKVSSNHGHIPYRNCILTSILRDSLGGNCRSGFILTLAMDRKQFEESVSTCRFGQRCGEAKVTVHANAEVSLADQVKDLNAHVKQLEKQVHVLEEEKAAICAELLTSKEYWQQVWEPRTLSSQEKVNCKLCVQNLFASAKESLALQGSANNTEDCNSPAQMITRQNSPNKIILSKEIDPKESLSSETEQSTKASASASAEGNTVNSPCPDTESLIERSREDLYVAVEKMDRAVLIELSIALGGLVQTMYLEREKAKAEEHRRLQRKTKVLADKEARLKAKFDIEEEEKAKNLAIKLAQDLKAQKEADEIEAMLAQAAAQPIGRLSPNNGSLVTSRVHSASSMQPCESPVLSQSSNSSVKERTDYGLSKESLSMLVTGTNFLVPNFLGIKGLKFFFVTTDIANIAARSNKGNHLTLTPFEKFESAELVKNVITLKGKSGVKSLNLEYPTKFSSEEDRDQTLEWFNSLSVCINRANGKRRLS